MLKTHEAELTVVCSNSVHQVAALSEDLKMVDPYASDTLNQMSMQKQHNCGPRFYIQLWSYTI